MLKYAYIYILYYFGCQILLFAKKQSKLQKSDRKWEHFKQRNMKRGVMPYIKRYVKERKRNNILTINSVHQRYII